MDSWFCLDIRKRKKRKKRKKKKKKQGQILVQKGRLPLILILILTINNIQIMTVPSKKVLVLLEVSNLRRHQRYYLKVIKLSIRNMIFEIPFLV